MTSVGNCLPFSCPKQFNIFNVPSCFLFLHLYGTRTPAKQRTEVWEETGMASLLLQPTFNQLKIPLTIFQHLACWRPTIRKVLGLGLCNIVEVHISPLCLLMPGIDVEVSFLINWKLVHLVDLPYTSFWNKNLHLVSVLSLYIIKTVILYDYLLLVLSLGLNSYGEKVMIWALNKYIECICIKRQIRTVLVKDRFLFSFFLPFWLIGWWIGWLIDLLIDDFGILDKVSLEFVL